MSICATDSDSLFHIYGGKVQNSGGGQAAAAAAAAASKRGVLAKRVVAFISFVKIIYSFILINLLIYLLNPFICLSLFFVVVTRVG